MLRVKGIPQEEVMKESKELIDELVEIIECPRDYFTIELINNGWGSSCSSYYNRSCLVW